MKSRALIIGTILSLVIAIMIPGVAAAKGGKPSQDDPPEANRLLYGDLVVVERDGAGVPLLKDFTYVDGEHGEVTVACLQPLAYDCSLLFLWGDCIDSEDCDFDPEAHDACEVHVDDAEFIQEVSFGRGSVTRSQAFVIDSAYGEFLKVINDAVELRSTTRRVENELLARGIDTKRDYMRDCSALLDQPGDFPVAARADRQVLHLPAHPELSERDMDRIAAAVEGVL